MTTTLALTLILTAVFCELMSDVILSPVVVAVAVVVVAVVDSVVVVDFRVVGAVIRQKHFMCFKQ